MASNKLNKHIGIFITGTYLWGGGPSQNEKCIFNKLLLLTWNDVQFPQRNPNI